MPVIHGLSRAYSEPSLRGLGVDLAGIARLGLGSGGLAEDLIAAPEGLATAPAREASEERGPEHGFQASNGPVEVVHFDISIRVRLDFF